MSENQVIFEQTTTPEQHPTYPHYRDIFDPKLGEELKNQLEHSHGKAFFIVHPFYLESTWYEGHFQDLVEGRSDNKDLIEFIQRAREQLLKLIEAGVPIVILQEIEIQGTVHLEDKDSILKTYKDLENRLKLLGISPEHIFVLYTTRGGPSPLRSTAEDCLESDVFVAKRMQILKSFGLKTGIVSGREFKPSEGDNFEFYADAANKDYGWGRTAEKTHKGWLLKDFFDKKKGVNSNPHPLQVIRPDQCVGEFLRMLAYNDIYPALGTNTYPDKIGISSKYVPTEYMGKTVYTKKAK